MITIKQNNDVYEVRFPYDPIIVNLIKSVPDKRWVPDKRMWTIPLNKLGFLYSQLKGTPYEDEVTLQSNECIDENEDFNSVAQIPDIDLSNVPFYIKPGAKPYPHQLDCMKYAISRQKDGNMSGFLLADEPGLGKTIMSTNLAIYNKYHYGFKRCLIICCVNSSKFNWEQDILEHTRGQYTPYILGTRMNKKKTRKLSTITGKDKLEDLKTLRMYGDLNSPSLPYFIITNIESLRMREGKQFTFVDEIIKLIEEGQLNMICIDEVHRNMSPTSSQGKQLLRIKKLTGYECEYIPITGTPIVSKPTDVFLPMRLIDAHSWNSFYMWSQKYCIYGGFGGHEILGYKNIKSIKSMVSNNMLRRLKQDVLDLPDKLYNTEYVENTALQSRMYKEIVNDLLSDREDIKKMLNPLVKFLKLRQVNGSPEILDEHVKDMVNSGDWKSYMKANARMARFLELLEEIHDRGEKVVVFSSWVEPLRTIYKLIKNRYGTCVFTGTMKESQRQKHKQIFMTNPKYTVILGTIDALGTTHTLTAATNVIFYDCPWTMVAFDQACDRVHRISTKSVVNIYKLITIDTVDQRVDDILFKKGQISQYIVDNIDIHSNPELFDLLLSDSV